MSVQILKGIHDRALRAKEDSDTLFFLALTYLGEATIKTIVLGMIAAIRDDKDRARYRLLHKLVRSDGIGDWGKSLDEIFRGIAAQHLCDEASVERADLEKRAGSGEWQHEAVTLMRAALHEVDPASELEPLPGKVDLKRWFSIFAVLRNKTKGHGATLGARYKAICPPLEKSILLVLDNFSLFAREWAFLHQNLSGKYKVLRLGEAAGKFDELKQKPSESMPDGVYVYFDRPTYVELIKTDSDAQDHFFPNGGFDDKKFELLSYLTDNKMTLPATEYLHPITDLPGSETEGIGVLDIHGQSFSNLPPRPPGYVSRLDLERELKDVLTDDRHPIITLLGRGGIGKTSLALRVLHQIANTPQFGALIWFSSRDIDLLPEGPKSVRPNVLTQKDIATEFTELTSPAERSIAGFKAEQYMSDAMKMSPIGEPLLFAFDNFETVRNPSELYTWISTYIRLPNKVLITTRERDFKADYPVEVLGMTDSESDELVGETASRLGIGELLSKSYREDILQEADGHPYVIKILLGEVAKAKKPVPIERIVASKDHILDALFERTYASLSQSARKVFLTACGWRSVIPQLAIEAVILSNAQERIDVENALDELKQSSFIEISVSAKDNEAFVAVPLAAAVFGRKKLEVSPYKAAVQADLSVLHLFGASQRVDVKHGVEPRMQRIFAIAANKLANSPEEESKRFVHMLQYIAVKFPKAWLWLSELQEELPEKKLTAAIEYTQRYIESGELSDEQKHHAWDRLARLYSLENDFLGEIHATVEKCLLANTSLNEISSSAGKLNRLLKPENVFLELDERNVLLAKLAKAFEDKMKNASRLDATDFSRLAWLFLRLGNYEKAREYTKRGLQIDPENQHCLGLSIRDFYQSA